MAMAVTAAADPTSLIILDNAAHESITTRSHCACVDRASMSAFTGPTDDGCRHATVRWAIPLQQMPPKDTAYLLRRWRQCARPRHQERPGERRRRPLWGNRERGAQSVLPQQSVRLPQRLRLSAPQDRRTAQAYVGLYAAQTGNIHSPGRTCDKHHSAVRPASQTAALLMWSEIVRTARVM